jgi:hypothetical protein
MAVERLIDDERQLSTLTTQLPGAFGVFLSIKDDAVARISTVDRGGSVRRVE